MFQDLDNLVWLGNKQTRQKWEFQKQIILLWRAQNEKCFGVCFYVDQQKVLFG